MGSFPHELPGYRHVKLPDVREIFEKAWGVEIDPEPGQRLHAIPGEGTHVPLWILGSSLYGAQLAAHLGLPYAFASHFAPDALEEAADIYRQTFRPSEFLERPHFMMAINVFGADKVDIFVSE
ncbi:MAG: LLM class flavin-dependent oxidoreductase [Alcanivorax sp.]|nr:LLM class flavin-dependent oxidoreductase [Alcanivorax sp.]